MNGNNLQRRCIHKMCIVVCMLLFLPSLMLAQQQREISGVVKDDKGVTIPGAAVLVVGTTKGTITDNNGKFTIAASDKAVLRISFVGYESADIKVIGKQNISITLQESSKSLDEVVVVGYGTQKKVHVTGSVSQVNSKDLLKAPMASVGEMMVGKLPGLTTVETSGQPGLNTVNILVRGTGTYNDYGGASPLYLVDGVERSFGNIDPNEIESISVLKDAAAGAVYGVKAGQGVIMITTKRGSKTGKPTVTYSGNLMLSQCTRMPEFLNGTEFIDWYTKAQDMDGSAHTFSDAFRAKVTDGDTSDGIENTNWMNLILRKISPTHQHNISINGGTDNVKYYVSAGYMNQDGIVKDLNFTRGNVRSNIDVNISKRLSMSVDIAGRKEDSYVPGASDFGTQNNNNVIYQAMVAWPFVAQNYNGLPTGAGAGTYNPPAYLANSGFQTSNKIILQSSASLKYKIPGIDGLLAKIFFSYDWSYSGSRTFNYGFNVNKFNTPTSTTPFGSWASTTYFATLAGGNLYDGDEKWNRNVIRPSLEYQKQFGKHGISALLLCEQTTTNDRTLSGSKRSFAVNDVIELNMGQTYVSPASGTSSSEAITGYVGRLNYDYDSKYLLELVCRRDGSYKFPSASRWGTFPSVSVGWVLSKEPFFNKLLPQVDLFKIKASAGRLGRDNVSSFLYNSYYSYLSTTPSVVFGNTSSYALTTTNSYPSSSLTWEKTNSYNTGFELNAWHSLLGIEFDVFYKYTYDILQGVGGAYPSSLGGYYPSVQNTGSVDVRGFEVSLSHKNTIRDFAYSITGNMSYAKNRILSKIQTEGICDWQNVLGKSTGTPTGFISTGLFQSQDQINNYSYYSTGKWVGDVAFKDINGDGQINSQDATFIGKPVTPAIYYGFSGSASYKNFDLTMNWQGAAVSNVQLCGYYSNGAADNTLATKAFYSSRNSSKYVVENSWTPENTNARFPRLSLIHVTGNGNPSSWWSENGAYLRLKSLTLGYNLPTKVIKMMGIQNWRIYIAGTNLLTFSPLKYFDPETPSVTNAYYPQQRTYSCGVNVTF